MVGLFVCLWLLSLYLYLHVDAIAGGDEALLALVKQRGREGQRVDPEKLTFEFCHYHKYNHNTSVHKIYKSLTKNNTVTKLEVSKTGSLSLTISFATAVRSSLY